MERRKNNPDWEFENGVCVPSPEFRRRIVETAVKNRELPCNRIAALLGSCVPTTLVRNVVREEGLSVGKYDLPAAGQISPPGALRPQQRRRLARLAEIKARNMTRLFLGG